MTQSLFSSNFFQFIVILAALLIIAGYSVPIAPFEEPIPIQRVVITFLALVFGIWWTREEAPTNGC